ncbi:MAG TPA: hypothetical protein VFR84_02010, partial [Candidatus Angelobacter sp.]|nr:hypothetical protein [Candidatus Angelobacter sp.]
IPALALAVVLSGCEHKKHPLIVPQQAPPTAEATPSPTPEATPAQPAQQESQPAPEQPKTEAAQPQQKESAKHVRKPSPRKPAGGDKSANEVARNNGPGRKIIPAEKAEPTPPGPISPGPTPADPAHDLASTDQLLQTAESNLSGIKRQLNKDEEAMRAQIREFISQSRKAITENDPSRAHNLAVKARVLSDELVKQR